MRFRKKNSRPSIDWISPIAALIFKGFGASDKVFPCRATLKNLDPRLRPGMSASAEIIIEREPNALLIPSRASFFHKGKPAVYVQKGQEFFTRPIEVGRRNEEDLVYRRVEGRRISALENPAEAAKRAKKKL